MRKILQKDLDNCENKCATSKTDVECCIVDCNYRETGVIFDGAFNDQAMLKLYENYLDDNGAGKYDQWINVVESSIKKCEMISELKIKYIYGKLINFRFQFLKPAKSTLAVSRNLSWKSLIA